MPPATNDKLARKWLGLARWAGALVVAACSTAAGAGWTAHKVLADYDAKLQTQDMRIAVDEAQRAGLKEEIEALRQDLRDFRRELASRRGLAQQQP